MQKSLKRVFALLLALAMVFSLTACGETGSGGGASTGGNVLSAEDAFDTDGFIASMPTELKGTTLTFFNWYDIEAREAEKKNIEAFEAASGINVEVIAPEWKQYTDKLAGLVATGDSPDVIRMSEPKSAWMKCLQPIVNTGYDFTDKAWNNDVKELYSVNGIQYAANLSYTPFIIFPTIQYYPSDMEEYGWDDPWELWKKGEWTWEKLREMSEEWIKQGPTYYGMATVVFDMPVSTRGLDFVTYDGSQWNLDLYNSAVLDAWKVVIEDRENRIFTQEGNFGKVSHNTLFSYSDSTCLEASSSYGSSMKKRANWGVVPPPKYEGEEYYAPISELVAWGVPKGAKNPKAVPYFISHYANLAKYDLDTFFYKDETIGTQAREVFENMVSQPNRYLNFSSTLFQFDALPLTWNLFHNGVSSQISTFIQSQEYRCQDFLNQHNDALKNQMDTEIKK